ncbi:T9SS type A sorting domain-containing protein [Hymenobacter sp. RP-2-7]|uniref:T9SS type A sorting domain-containing protein n=1 Tax=Hymenobacter polaris TaxID=2682546 RepID=A0A7Y0AFF8_9BACT|nr:T9SS type A sorting domain-containing protein [Hymenobacter polaris]NML66337.1 T9SS type A sorting domain-containing protein [Hymenobacter polaris]
MKNTFTLSALAALLAAGFSAQAQFTVDGTLGSSELGTGTGKYQLVGTYTGTHSVSDRGLKALYMGTTATTLNVLVVCTPEQASGVYTHTLLYLDVPGKTGVAAGTALPGVSGNTPLTQKPTLDLPNTDYVFRITTSPLDDQPGAMYLSRADYTVATPVEVNMGSAGKNGTVTSDGNDPSGATTAYKTSSSVAANTTTGWEFSIPLSALGGAAAGSNINVMVGYVRDSDKGFYSDVLPQIAGQTTDLGLNPNFTTIAGKQYYTYQVGTGVLVSRAASSTLATSAYPNPLGADSRLSYTVAGASAPVSVVAYNTLGQPALTLLDGAPQPAGEHTLALAPLQRLAAGVYLLHVRAGDQLSTQRVVVR